MTEQTKQSIKLLKVILEENSYYSSIRTQLERENLSIDEIGGSLYWCYNDFEDCYSIYWFLDKIERYLLSYNVDKDFFRNDYYKEIDFSED